MLQASQGRPRCAICSVASSVEVTSTLFLVIVLRACHALMSLMVDDTRHAATILIPQFQRTSSHTLRIGDTLGSRIHAVPRNEINSSIVATTALIPSTRTLQYGSIVNCPYGTWTQWRRTPSQAEPFLEMVMIFSAAIE